MLFELVINKYVTSILIFAVRCVLLCHIVSFVRVVVTYYMKALKSGLQTKLYMSMMVNVQNATRNSL
jgi:hypothetical protein